MVIFLFYGVQFVPFSMKIRGISEITEDRNKLVSHSRYRFSRRNQVSLFVLELQSDIYLVDILGHMCICATK